MCREVIHSFIEAGMLRNFDARSFSIVPKDVLSSFWQKTKKDTFACIWLEFCTAFTMRTNPDSTAKGTEIREVVWPMMDHFKWRMFLIPRGKAVIDAQPVVESIRPKLDIKICTSEKSTDSIGHGLMTTFYRAILVGGVGASRTNFIADNSQS